MANNKRHHGPKQGRIKFGRSVPRGEAADYTPRTRTEVKSKPSEGAK